jgi:hypothetical protein
MEPSSRTPEGLPNRCPVCGNEIAIDPSRPAGDAPCPYCGHLLWFPMPLAVFRNLQRFTISDRSICTNVQAIARSWTTKALRPMASLTLAGVLGGVAMATCAAIVLPDARTVLKLLIWFGIGAVGSLIAIAPIVAGEVFRTPLTRLLEQRAFHVNWYVSLLMAMAMGYVFASAYHQMFDKLTAVSLVAVFLGAWVKTLLGTVYERQGGDG